MGDRFQLLASDSGGGGVSGITRLTDDVLAGPGSGSQAATVAKIRGIAVSTVAPATGQVLTATGLQSAAWLNPLAYSAYKAIDIDFRLLPSQTIGSDGLVVGGVGGYDCYKYNSANEDAPLSVVAGTGLRFSPASNSNVWNASLTSPMLWFPLAGLGIPDLSWSSKFRLWVEWDNDPSGLFAEDYNTQWTASMAQPGFGGITNPSMQLSLRGYRYNPWYGASFGLRYITNSQNQLDTGLHVASLDASNRGGVMPGTLLPGRLTFHPLAYGATWSSDLVPSPLVVYDTQSVAIEQTYSAGMAPTNMGVAIGALRAGSASSFVTSCTRMRLEFLP